MHFTTPNPRGLMKKIVTAIIYILAITPDLVNGQQIDFGNAWKEQRFSIFSSNDYTLNGDSLDIKSKGTVSLLWSFLPPEMWNKKYASWEWAVEKSVPASDLTQKGGDDRNLALYFIFLPKELAKVAQDNNVRALLNNPDVRILMYVWGGAHKLQQIVSSPHLGSRGQSIIKQLSGTGTALEFVDLRLDHKRAFSEDAESLVGLAVSSDSDDTQTEVLAKISQFRIE
tara:strand:- start:747 stop:1427 length:681 start_codon:yes stop_codon:yes gene_type:complete